MVITRTVVEELGVSAILDDAAKADPRVRQLFDGLVWRICRQPEAGYLVPASSPPLRIVRSDDLPGFPSVVVLAYTYTADKVNVISAKVDSPEVAATLKLA